MNFLTTSFLLIIIFLQSFSTGDLIANNNQEPDSLSSRRGYKQNYKQYIVPISLVATGIFINSSDGALGKENLQEKIITRFPDFQSNADDYLQWAPVVEIYLADLLGAEAKNNVFHQTKYLVISLVANSILTSGLKQITGQTRPNGHDYSFPSGHTSHAFTSATVLYHEFKDTEKLLAYSGFLFAGATGVLRVLNNKHWVSDVLAGAGLGILVSHVVYQLEPLKNWDPFNLDSKSIGMTLVPGFGNNNIKIYFALQF